MRDKFDFRIQREKWRDAIGCGRGIAQVAGDGAAILDLNAANLTGCEFQSVEAGRQGGLNNFGPGGEAADPDMVRFNNHTFEFAHARDIDNNAGDGAVAQRGKEISAACQDLAAGAGENVYGFG